MRIPISADGEIRSLRTEVQVVTDEWVAARDEIRRLRAVNAALLEALVTLRRRVKEGGVPRYTVTPGAALNAVIEEVVDPAIALAKGEKP